MEESRDKGDKVVWLYEQIAEWAPVILWKISLKKYFI